MTILNKDKNNEIKVLKSNPSIGYFPAKTNPKEGAFDWDIAKAIVIRNLYNKLISKEMQVGTEQDAELYQLFSDLCKREFELSLDDPAAWTYLESMYFSPDTFFNLAPECLLFHLTGNYSTSKNALGDMYSSLMQSYSDESPERVKRNFLDQKIVEILRSPAVLNNFEKSRFSKKIDEEPYLPFLSELFCKDIKFMSDHPKYLMQNLEEMLRLYGYIYTAQLALNINGFSSDFSSNEPFSRPVFFILENETASVERTNLVKNGHQNVAKNLKRIFPYLTSLETIHDVASQRKRTPIWKLPSLLTAEDVEALKQYAENFAEDRKIDFSFVDKSLSDPTYWLKVVLKLSLDQFERGESRYSAQDKFIKSTEKELCSTFVRSRGRAGKVLVMNQDYLTLLTNLCIGQNDRLRFHDLLDEFTQRGVCFDKRSQQALIKFYERVGNVDRMSDSGDAVYVRKTV